MSRFIEPNDFIVDVDDDGTLVFESIEDIDLWATGEMEFDEFEEIGDYDLGEDEY